MQVHMERDYGKHIDWMYRFTTIATTVLAAMLISISSANASSVYDFSENSDHYSGTNEYFKFSIDDHGAPNETDSYKQSADKIQNGSGDSGDGYNTHEWGNGDSSSSSRNGKDNDGDSRYTASHDENHDDFSWLSDHDKYFKHDKWRKNDHEDDHRDFWDDKDDRCNPPAPVPVPGAVWLFCSGLIGLLPLASRRNRRTANG